jgi:Zn-dependent protease
MLLQEPAESPYDLRFELFGFPIRIAWTFWIGAVLFGYNLALSFDEMGGAASPGLFPLLFLWSVCLLVSITIHELGHAFAFRYYGIESSIVLYHFGALAIPNSGSSDFSFASSLTPRRLDEKGELIIALAGPVAQMISALVLVAVVVRSGFEVVAFRAMPWPISNLSQFTMGEQIESVGLMACVFFYVLPSVLWALLNLVPVFPLDGGRVMRSLVLLSGDRSDTWVWISLISAGGVALYSLTHGQPFLGLMFLSLAAGNYQMLQRPF